MKPLDLTANLQEIQGPRKMLKEATGKIQSVKNYRTND